jgi:hypothetical protein
MRSLLLLSLAGSSVAIAAPGVTLPSGTVSTTITTEINASNDVMGSPSSIAPDLAFGATDNWSLSLVTSTFATTGFRGGAGSGACFGDACTRVFNNAGFEGAYGLGRRYGLVAGVFATNLDERWFSAKLGGRLRVPVGRVTFASSPSVFVALDDRNINANRDRLYVPLSALVRIVPELSIGCSTGVKAPIDNVQSAWEVAAGANVQFSLAPWWLVGASWVHGKLLGGSIALPEGTSGWDFRAIQVWFAVTR